MTRVINPQQRLGNVAWRSDWFPSRGDQQGSVGDDGSVNVDPCRHSTGSTTFHTTFARDGPGREEADEETKERLDAAPIETFISLSRGSPDVRC